MKARMLLGIAAVAIGALLAAAPTGAQTAQPPSAVFVIDETGRLLYKPVNLRISPGLRITNIKWRLWRAAQARGQGRFRVPRGAVPGLEARYIKVRLKLSQPIECEVFDKAGNLLGTAMVLEKITAKSIGKPGYCAVVCSIYHNGC